jgi:hypothetical protein
VGTQPATICCSGTRCRSEGATQCLAGSVPTVPLGDPSHSRQCTIRNARFASAAGLCPVQQHRLCCSPWFTWLLGNQDHMLCKVPCTCTMQHRLYYSPCCTELPPSLVRTLTVCVHSINTCIHLVAGGSRDQISRVNLPYIASVMTEILSYSADAAQTFPQRTASSTAGDARSSCFSGGTTRHESLPQGECSKSVTWHGVHPLGQEYLYVVWWNVQQ